MARDRAGAYADGIRQGAPKAVQVSDRWHLLRNLGDAVRAVVDRHHGDLRRAAQQMVEPLPIPPAEEAPLEPAVPRVTAAQRRRQDAHARRHDRYEKAASLRAAGSSISAIAASLGAERKTVRRWLRAGKAPLWKKPPQGSILTQHEAYLDGRWAEGCRNAALLWRELVGLGFCGRPGIVGKWAEGRRKAKPQTHATSTGMTGLLPTTGQLARLLMTNGDVLPKAERGLVAHLLNEVPPVAAAIAVAKKLNALLRRKASESLTQILDTAVATPLKDFAVSLRRDIAAIQAALDLPWTTSPVEGQINRLKMLKRTMYGRAGFQLLRARVLHTAQRNVRESRTLAQSADGYWPTFRRSTYGHPGFAGGLGVDWIARVELFEQLRQEHEFGVGTIAGVAAKFGVHRRMVRQAIAGALPPRHRYPARAKPKLDAVVAFIDEVLDEDRRAPRKQRHTARRIYRRILAEFPAVTLAEYDVLLSGPCAGMA